MFFSKVLTKNQRYAFAPEKGNEYRQTLSLTNLTLAPASKEGALVYIKKGTQEFLVASLTKERPQVTINIFITLTDNIEIAVKGNGIIHVVGFFEPINKKSLDLDGEESEDLGDEELAEEQVVKPRVSTPATQKPASLAQQPAVASKGKSAPAARPEAQAKSAHQKPAKKDDSDLNDVDDLDKDEDEHAKRTPHKVKPQSQGKPYQNNN